MHKDTSKAIEEYLKKGFDYGFTSVSEMPLEVEIKKKEASEEELRGRLKQVEELIMPFLVNMLTADRDYILWPVAKRKPVLEQNIEKLLTLTRE